MKFHTICVHGNKQYIDYTGSVNPPIYMTSTFAHPALGKSTGYDYTRIQNPTREHLENTINLLENGKGTLAFSSGMAAIACVMELFNPGDHILISHDLYGGSLRFFKTISEKNGVHFTSLQMEQDIAIQDFIRPNTKAIFIETPSNPMMNVVDLHKAARVAKENQLLLIVDNTFLTPYFQKPLALGADIVVHSGTKYLCGHNDVLAGFAVTATESLAERLRNIYKNTGACLSAFDSYLILRGLKTLPLRMERHQQNALALATFLQNHPKVETVHYVGLPAHPGYEINKKQSSGFGGMISFTTKTIETAAAALERCRLILFSESLGGTETLITYPITQTHAEITQEEKERSGIHERLLRLSVGLEDADDLIQDLSQALQ